MSSPESRFTSQNKTTQERLSTTTVGLVALSDFRKRRAEVLEQQEREAREVLISGVPSEPPDRSCSATPNNVSDTSLSHRRKKKQRVQGNDEGKKADRIGIAKLSFGTDEDFVSNDVPKEEGHPVQKTAGKRQFKFKANTSVSVVPRSVTKAALLREAAEREALRREFLVRQEAVKAAEIVIPFVFYDGTDIPGGTVRVKKGDFVWVFLDKSRKVGADLGLGEKANARREWARVGVDDLMMVRGNIIVPHHYDFMFFIMNKAVGPTGRLLFDYRSDISGLSLATSTKNENVENRRPAVTPIILETEANAMEGASDDPAFTKVVDRRWYERNKHIYPASIWQEFDPEKDYPKEVRRDLGGNAFFYS
ncbi:XAP5-domain-containing protein [Annulohypoxylon maeteangense]|uniref:XAP5-domain-containing protein n=1 Tax=Annulohypoxylon maeteangense TaxID=1927788 RepID=UPI0020076B50|nr:XAP5-domain-containing protein [Annulohypoxylon maeteangense]KAI0889493.1 XAP5-domain-containing protein [Annulohypoxylon maeteangense]